jgi:hypothetical protein
MEEHKRSYSVSSSKSAKSEIMRVFSKRETNVPGAFSYAFTESVETGSLLRVEEMIKIPDLKLAMHCHLIQNMILGKILSSVLFLVGVGYFELFVTLPAIFLEFLGFCGSLNLKAAPNYAFLVYLGLNIVFRTISSIYAFSCIESGDDCFSLDTNLVNNSCDVYGKFILGSGLFIAFELIQIYSTFRLILKISKIPEAKKEEMYYVLTAQKIPRFICCGKLKSWKLVI